MGADAKRKEARKRKFGDATSIERRETQSTGDLLQSQKDVSDDLELEATLSARNDVSAQGPEQPQESVQRTDAQKAPRFIAFIGQQILQHFNAGNLT